MYVIALQPGSALWQSVCSPCFAPWLWGVDVLRSQLRRASNHSLLDGQTLCQTLCATFFRPISLHPQHLGRSCSVSCRSRCTARPRSLSLAKSPVDVFRAVGLPKAPAPLPPAIQPPGRTWGRPGPLRRPISHPQRPPGRCCPASYRGPSTYQPQPPAPPALCPCPVPCVVCGVHGQALRLALCVCAAPCGPVLHMAAWALMASWLPWPVGRWARSAPLALALCSPALDRQAAGAPDRPGPAPRSVLTHPRKLTSARTLPR